MRRSEDVYTVISKLLETGRVFENDDSGVLPLRIPRKVSSRQSVDLLPILKEIYFLTLAGKTRKSAELLSELTSLLIAADLGIAQEFMLELEVKHTMPRAMKILKKDLEKSSKEVKKLDTL